MVSENIQQYQSDYLNKAIIPVCSGYDKPHESIIHTIGNGFIFEYDGYVWVLSARHLLEREFHDHTVKVVLKWKGTNYILILNKKSLLRYHPSDQDSSTLDLALYCFGKKENFGMDYPLLPLSFSSENYDCKEDEILNITGYPSGRLNPKIIFQNKKQPVYNYEGRYINLDDEFSFSPQDYGKRLVKQEIINMESIGGIELSGGIVFKRGDNYDVPQGMITGSGSVQLKLSEEEPARQINIMSFISFRYLKDMI